MTKKKEVEGMKKIVAISGSPKANGNTVFSINVMKEVFSQHGMETEIISVGHLKIHGCVSCGQCARNKNEMCHLDDEVNDIIGKLKDADGIILASPVYFAGMSGPLKSVLDRVFYVAGMNGGLFKHKASAAIAVARRAGTTSTFNQLVDYLSYAQTFIAPSTYWPGIFGGAPQEAALDIEGVETLQTLAQNMVYLINSKQEDMLVIPKKKTYMSFIR